MTSGSFLTFLFFLDVFCLSLLLLVCLLLTVLAKCCKRAHLCCLCVLVCLLFYFQLGEVYEGVVVHVIVFISWFLLFLAAG